MDLLQTLKFKCINKTTAERSNSLTDFATATVGNKQMYIHVIPFKVWGQSVSVQYCLNQIGCWRLLSSKFGNWFYGYRYIYIKPDVRKYIITSGILLRMHFPGFSTGDPSNDLKTCIYLHFNYVMMIGIVVYLCVCNFSASDDSIINPQLKMIGRTKQKIW